jgi:hypothetical protein
MPFGYAVKTLERESASKLKETTVTHNSVFAAANCTSTKCRIASEARSGISFLTRGPRIYAIHTDFSG